MKIVIFSDTRPDGILMHGSAENGWVFINDRWSGGHITNLFSHLGSITATSTAEVVSECARTARIVEPSVFDASKYTPECTEACCSELILDELSLPVNDVSRHGKYDRIRWTEYTKSANLILYGRYNHFQITEATTRAVHAGHFGSVTEDGFAEYRTGGLFTSRCETADIHVTRCLWFNSSRASFLAVCTAMI